MSLILKKSQHLITLFKGVNTQDSFTINKNINELEHLLKTPSETVRKIMAKQNVYAEDLLAEKNLVLTRFYLSDEQTQMATFLDVELLALFFKALPMAEATIFKQYMRNAQSVLPLPDIKLQSALTLEGLNDEGELDVVDTEMSDSEETDNIVDFQAGYAQHNYLHKLQHLSDSLEVSDEADYEAHYYALEKTANLEGDQVEQLVVKAEYESGLMLYCELSPLMQIKAQKLFKVTSEQQPIKLFNATA